jgi:glutamine synthetase
MATKYKLEYIWLDGYKPVPNLRGKTSSGSSMPSRHWKICLYGFDGSSTQQAEVTHPIAF